MSKAKKLSGAHKAALVIMSLEEEVAAQVMQNLEEHELRQLAKAVEEMDPLPTKAVEPALEAFAKGLAEPRLHAPGGPDYMRRVAAHALGKERAELLFTSDHQREALEIIRAAREATLAELLHDEHAQLAAVVLSQLPGERAAKVLLCMREDRQADLIMRIASLESIPMRSLEVASANLAKTLRDSGGLGSADDRPRFDGISFAAGLFNEFNQDVSDRLMEEIEDSMPELVPQIREAMFTFEDLSQIDNRSLQVLMREVSSEQLLAALKTASESLREKFFAAVSTRAAQTMREDLEFMPAKRLSEVEEAQRGIVEAAMRLASEGAISLRAGEELV